jgi:hypothetical protein
MNLFAGLPSATGIYVLVRHAAYQRWKSFLSLDDFDPDEAATSVNEVMAKDDSNDPLLESYQHYGSRG